jgi:hypothetical protein
MTNNVFWLPDISKIFFPETTGPIRLWDCTRFFIGSVYSYNNFQQIVVRIAANLIFTTNDITESIQWGREFLFKIAIIYSALGSVTICNFFHINYYFMITAL